MANPWRGFFFIQLVNNEDNFHYFLCIVINPAMHTQICDGTNPLLVTHFLPPSICSENVSKSNEMNVAINKFIVYVPFMSDIYGILGFEEFSFVIKHLRTPRQQRKKNFLDSVAEIWEWQGKNNNKSMEIEWIFLPSCLRVCALISAFSESRRCVGAQKLIEMNDSEVFSSQITSACLHARNYFTSRWRCKGWKFNFHLSR